MAANREHFGTHTTVTPDAATIAGRLSKARRSGAGWVACCPAHDDGTPSLSINDSDKGPLFHCHAGCSQDAVLNAIEALGVQIRKVRNEADVLHPLLNLESLAAAKGLSMETLTTNHVIEGLQSGVGFEYVGADGRVTGTKYRKYLGGVANRGFSWGPGSKPTLYGLWRLERDYANDGRVIICEGETDALTLWQAGFTALALPGASMWKDEWAIAIPEGAKIYVILEPDQGGRTVEAAIQKSAIRKRAYFVRMPESTKDPNQLHLVDPSRFVDDFNRLLTKAEPVVTGGLKGINLKDMQPHLNGAYLVKGLLPAKSEAWIIGSSGCGKTFLSTDLALHIAHNKPYRGKRVRGGLVVYVGAENPTSIERRFAAAADHNGFGRDAPLKLTGGPIDLRDPESLDEIVEFVRNAEEEHRQQCVALFVDTLARSGGGKEDAEDFGAALRGADHLRDTLSATIIMIHHLGKDVERGGRGHSGFLGGVDTEITCSEEGDTRIAVITKNRDGKEGDRMAYKLRPVTLGTDEDGDEVITCVVDHFDADAIPPRKPNGKAQSQLLAELERRASTGEETVWTEAELREIAREIGQHKATARSAVLGLRQLGYFQPTVGGTKLIFIPEAPKK